MMIDPLGNLRRTWSVWDMMRSKKRISQAAKDKARTAFEDAVLEYAAMIEQGRWEAEQMAEYNGGLM